MTIIVVGVYLAILADYLQLDITPLNQITIRTIFIHSFAYSLHCI